MLTHGLIETGDSAAVLFEDGGNAIDDLQVFGDAGAHFMYIACAERDEQIARTHGIAHDVSRLEHRRCGVAFDVGLSPHFFQDGLSTHTGQRFLAGRVNVRDKEFLHVSKSSAELFFQKLSA